MSAQSSKTQVESIPSVKQANVPQGAIEHIGIRIHHALHILLSFCDDSMEKRTRQVMLVNLCEQVVSWAPTFFNQENLSDTAYQIYLVAFFGRHSINNSLHKHRLHRKRFLRNLPNDFVSATMNNPVFSRWTRSPVISGKSNTNPVLHGGNKFLIETMDIWLHESSTDLALQFNTELEKIERFLSNATRDDWPSFLVSSIDKPIQLGMIGGGEAKTAKGVDDTKWIEVQNSLSSIKGLLISQQQLQQGGALEGERYRESERYRGDLEPYRSTPMTLQQRQRQRYQYQRPTYDEEEDEWYWRQYPPRRRFVEPVSYEKEPIQQQPMTLSLQRTGRVPQDQRTPLKPYD